MSSVRITNRGKDRTSSANRSLRRLSSKGKQVIVSKNVKQGKMVKDSMSAKSNYVVKLFATFFLFIIVIGAFAGMIYARNKTDIQSNELKVDDIVKKTFTELSSIISDTKNQWNDIKTTVTDEYDEPVIEIKEEVVVNSKQIKIDVEHFDTYENSNWQLSIQYPLNWNVTELENKILFVNNDVLYDDSDNAAWIELKKFPEYDSDNTDQLVKLHSLNDPLSIIENDNGLEIIYDNGNISGHVWKVLIFNNYDMWHSLTLRSYGISAIDMQNIWLNVTQNINHG